MAMLAVITAVAICLVIVNEFGTSTTIDMMQSRNNLDQMRASYLARSSLNLTELIVRLQQRLDNASADFQQLQGVQITDFADPLMAAFGGDAEQVQAAIGLSMDMTKGLGADIGTFGVRITPVDGKINVNCGATGNEGERALLARELQSLIYPPAFDPIFEEADADGWRRDRREQVSAIIDYIDQNQTRTEIRDDKVENTSAPEDYGYENLRDQYKPKNNRIDSVAELKLVRGVDDRFWTLFGNAFRVQGGCKVNLRALDDPKVVAAVISLAAKDPNDPVLRDPTALWAIANMVITAKQFGFYFVEPGEFVTFVKDPAAAFAGLAGGGGDAGQPAIPVAGLPQLPPGIKGIELDTGNLNKVAMSGTIENYQVEAWGEVERTPFMPARRTLRAFWNQKHTNQNARNLQLTRTGAWLYLREE
jgi:general secretion pathway protein K